MTEFRILSALSAGGRPGPESSILKTLSGSATQRLTALAVELIGWWAVPNEPDARHPGSPLGAVSPADMLTPTARSLNTRAASIAGGTDEVQRNIVARLVLGL
jgi:acyl-CoA dehydrogenase